MPDKTLQLWGRVHVAKDRDTLFDDLARAMWSAAGAAIDARGVFHLALSGGWTPEPFYMHLVIDPRFRLFPWDKSHVWMVDERRVPLTDDKSNFRMIKETLTDHVPMRSRQVHPVPVETDDPGQAYESELNRVYGEALPSAASSMRAGATPRLDFVLLGMGDDGHTASLFPGSPALRERSRWVIVNDGPAVTPPPRITMTYPLLNAARDVAVLVTGAKKTATLRRVDEQFRTGGPDRATLPITGIEPADGKLSWYLDPDAAGW
jgi:6-phosphogluconolactonase